MNACLIELKNCYSEGLSDAKWDAASVSAIRAETTRLRQNTQNIPIPITIAAIIRVIAYTRT